MTEAEIITNIRDGMREYGVLTVTSEMLSATVIRGVVATGLRIRQADPSFFLKRVSCTSSTHIFPWPTGCVTIRKVWDLEAVAGTITNATNATPIVITEATHGRDTGHIVTIHDVTGNTATNGTWYITKIDDDSYSLGGSIGNEAYVSGGKVFKNKKDYPEIQKINPSDANLSHYNRWYPRGKTIVIDDMAHTNDILVDYIYNPSAVEDIPEEYHDGIVAFGVLRHLKVPEPATKGYEDAKNSYAYFVNVREEMKRQIQLNMKSSSEPSYIRDVW